MFVRDNTFDEWDMAGVRTAGVSIDDAMAGDVLNNTFRSEDAMGSAVRVEAGATNVSVLGNKIFAPDVLAEPFVNLGAQSNLGTFEVEAGATSATISHEMVDPSAELSVGQSEGAVASFATWREAGSFRVDFDAPLQTRAVFRYEIASCRSHPDTVNYLGLNC